MSSLMVRVSTELEVGRRIDTDSQVWHTDRLRCSYAGAVNVYSC